jgi:2-dehydro-3-deoxyphosphooctonate aldolase (KDO 8-P synthase)
MADKKLIYIAGPCVLENVDLTLEIAGRLKAMTESLNLDFIFKASYDKANRTSLGAFRGPGLTEGLKMLQAVKDELGIPVLSDVHEVHAVEEAAEVLDVIQIPAYLSRQTDLVVEIARSGKKVNVKKAQFTAPEDVQYVVDKITDCGNDKILLTERGTCFGYNNLVVDYRSFSTLRKLGFPVIFDATHSVQIPSAGGASSGNREYVIPLAKAAAAYGIDGLFTEVYPDPDDAQCDGPNSLALNSVPALLKAVQGIREISGSESGGV